jgi:hypothetical protein
MPPPIIKPDAYRIQTQGIAAVVNARCLGPSLAHPGTMVFKSADQGEFELKLPQEFAGFCQKDEMVVFSITLIRNTLGAAVNTGDQPG